ncbi:nicotinate-nucleotide-dimethylbenzimidazole phosphoribosyltransferase [Melghirimyces profundicolus]|uniref:Nicotinate-nucleotide--dimethylbenzimidazole phosphoribosyltransferase n=1 Tax=Melghirimyces profundicolus TaxID=1242148 RepID=A0A2T6C7P3_9BACL|nr:nicotinate-nucleotide-dimethylbenzimidazole phosphoribosyltransferase [Melghirimyces profundicolus]
MEKDQWLKGLMEIPVTDEKAEKEARNHMDQLTKPLGALGDLEEIVIRLAGITGETVPDIERKGVAVFCGDHGVTEEGVSAYPAEVTGLMIGNFSRGKAAVTVLARRFGAEVSVVDVGSRLEPLPEGVLDRKVRFGTANMARGPAMTREETLKALRVGADLALQWKENGIQLAAVGEMGIGNTTSASAVAAVLTGKPVRELTGRGTGLDDDGLERKREVITRSLEVNRPDPADPLDGLAKVGGLEIAAMTGFILGAARHRLPVVVDGLISTVAALAAVRLAPGVRACLFASHRSAEPAHGVLLEDLGLKPLITAGMRLGEGSGAVLAFPLFDGAVTTAKEMATFSELGLNG